MKHLANISLNDRDADRSRRDHAEAIAELQRLPAVGLRVIEGISLADGIVTLVPHGLGRPALFVRESCPRGASTTGRVEEVRDGTHDRSKGVALKAAGWGATIIVDVLVM